jgi:hypothetical protein
MPLSLAVVVRPIQRCSLALIASASRPIPSRVLVLVVLAPPVACRTPARAKTGVGGAGARAPLLVRPPSRAKPLLVTVVLARRHSLPALTLAARTDKPLHSPPLCCIYMFQLSQTFQIYVAIVLF